MWCLFACSQHFSIFIRSACVERLKKLLTQTGSPIECHKKLWDKHHITHTLRGMKKGLTCAGIQMSVYHHQSYRDQSCFTSCDLQQHAFIHLDMLKQKKGCQESSFTVFSLSLSLVLCMVTIPMDVSMYVRANPFFGWSWTVYLSMLPDCNPTSRIKHCQCALDLWIPQ